MSPLLPGAVIGIVGGGQLGRMTAMAAARLGYSCHVFTDRADAPAAQVVSRATVASYDDPGALEAFGRAVDVVTFEFENLPATSLERLAGHAPVRPSPAVLRTCQDRLLEKRFLDRIEAPSAPWRPLREIEDLDAVEALEAPWVLKTARFGYDGKGQRKTGPGDLEAAWAELGHVPAIVESEIPFEREISVIVARGCGGGVASFVPVENRHENHILRQTIAPAPIGGETASAARRLAERITVALDVVGLLAVEMFVDQGGRLLVNELAPRPHNSGHWTLDACAVSQFEQLIRAVTGLPLGDPSQVLPATMTNLLGEEVLDLDPILREPGARLHLYGKAEVRAGRKLGHVTRLAREPG
ncbi:MAG: 5-(carboxyamino)imidazole ribonucleotide synthase [Geminicoccaceae bacterium]|nr:5-(carboxyamino)imidazole ribonucleotide synthase [Geminicoccaceae bacterium]